MPLLTLWFESGEASLDVRRFSVHEAMSSLFSASVWARSPNENIDLETLVGHGASLRVTAGAAGGTLGTTRCFHGVCAHMEQQHAEPTGLSTYYLRIAPSLWLLTQRTNHRIFQRKSVPDIADEMLAEWQIQPTWRIDRDAYPKLDFRVQYGESDFAFLCRMLEEAGISFFFLDDDGSESKLVLSDTPHLAEPREGALTFVDNPSVTTPEILQNVRFAQQVRPSKVAVRDHDFRKPARYSLLKDTGATRGVESRLEVYRYQPGSFLTLQKSATKAAPSSGSGGGGDGAVGGLWGEVKGELEQWRDEAVQKTDDKLTSLVGSKVQDALTKAVGKLGSNLAGSIMGEVMGGVLGEIAGDVGGKVVSDLLGGDRGPLSLDLEKMFREKVAATIEGRLDGAIDKLSDFVDDKVTDKVGDLLDGAIGDKLADKVGGFVGDKANAMIDKVAGYAKDKLVDAIKGGSGGGASGGGNEPQAGDDKGMVRHDERAGLALANRALEGIRADRRRVSFDTSAVDLRPGTVFSVLDHPRPELSPKAKLLVTDLELEGSPADDWHIAGSATFADVPYRPPLKTPKPSITGLQSAIVVGPGSEEIHTDEHGRVRAQFHWDRSAQFDDNSSLWMRVAQGWAGAGYGAITIPRVGTEVLVSFLEGDPDQPVVVGRVFNATSPVPHKLPDNKTVSTWRTASTPGGEGYNELLFDDAKGRELVYLKAERNLTKLVQRDETGVIQRSKQTTVGKDQTTLVMFNETLTVGKHRTLTVGKNFNEMVGKDHLVNVGGSRTENVAKNLTLSIGKAMAEKKKPENDAPGGGDEKKEEETGVYKMKIENKLEIEVGKAKITVTKDGKVKIEGVEFEFKAEGHVQISGAIVDLN